MSLMMRRSASSSSRLDCRISSRLQADARDPRPDEHHRDEARQSERGERRREDAQSTAVRSRVAADDETDCRPIAERPDVARKRAQRRRHAGHRHLTAAVVAAAQFAQRREALAVLEARVVAHHPEPDATVGRRQRVHLGLHPRPAFERAGAFDRVLQVLQVGAQLLELMPIELAREHLVERGADQAERDQRRRGEHGDEASCDRQPHLTASSGRASST
jgi:hypothetical protein